MKNTLIAGALLCASAGALAQSSVTIYGLVDLYGTRYSGAPGGVNATNRPMPRLDSGGMTTSRWGIRGKEDLGGGVDVSFNISGFLRVDTGQAGRSDAVGTVGADPIFSRETSLSVSDKTLGQVRVGGYSTLMFSQSLAGNAFLSSTVFSPLNVLTFIGSPLSGGTGWNNQIGYDSPVWNGLSASATYSLSEGQHGSNASAAAAYGSGPVSLAFAWQTVKKDPLTFADGTSPNNTKAWQLMGAYDFKVVKVYAHAGVIDNDGTEKTPLNIRYKIWETSASIPVGAAKVLLAYGTRRTDDAVGPAPAAAFGGNKQRDVASVGYDYFLSKRTDAYAVVMHDKTRSNTLPAPGHYVEASATNIGIGVRHTF